MSAALLNKWLPSQTQYPLPTHNCHHQRQPSVAHRTKAWRDTVKLRTILDRVFKHHRPNKLFVGIEYSTRMTCEHPPTPWSMTPPKLFRVPPPSRFDALPSRQMTYIWVNPRSGAVAMRVTTTITKLSTISPISQNIYRHPPDWCQSRCTISISRMNWHASTIYCWVIRMKSFFTITPISIRQQGRRTAMRTMTTTTTSKPKSMWTSRMTLMIIISTMAIHFHHYLRLTIHSQIIPQ